MAARALFLGRFQPMHLGHVEVVRRLAREHDEVVVAVGSANVSHTQSNPFTAGERVAMVDGALKDARVANAIVVPIPDVGRNAVWVAHVESYVHAFDVLYTNNPLMTRLFQEAGHRVEPAPFHERARFEGTRIRQLMRDGGDWEPLVPKATARIVAQCHGIERLRSIGHADVKVEGRDPSLGG